MDADTNQISIYFPGENTVRERKFILFNKKKIDIQKVWYDIRTFAQHNGSQTVLVNVDMNSVGYEEILFLFC